VLLAVLWGCGLIVRAYAGSLDLSGVRDLATVRTPALTDIAHALSTIGSSYVVLPLAGICAAALLLSRHLPHASLIAGSALGAVVIENLDKLLVDRPRPEVRHLETVSSSSFPSGHATQAAAVYGSAMLLAVMLLPSQGRGARILRGAAVALGVLLVCAIGFSRIYLGVHYPTDVAAGLVLGGVWTGLVWRVVRRHTAVSTAGSRPGSRVVAS
jgi:undecaprenyl-diphosphatase